MSQVGGGVQRLGRRGARGEGVEGPTLIEDNGWRLIGFKTVSSIEPRTRRI